MPQYDGSININTKIDTKNVSSQMLRLENQIAKASKKASDLTQKMREMEKSKIPTEQYSGLQKTFDELISKGKKLSEQIKGIEKYVPTQAYKNAETKLDSVSGKQDHLNHKMKEWVALGRSTNSISYKKMQMEFSELSKESDRLLMRLSEMESTGQDRQINKKWSDLKNQMREVGEEASRVKSKMRGMENSGISYIDPKSTADYKKYASQLRDVNAQMNVLSKRHDELVRKEKSVSDGAISAKKSTSGWLDSFTRKTRKSSGILSSFASRLKGMALSLFVFNWITKGWNVMISAIKDGTQSVARYSADVNAKMSSLSSAVATLKNSFASLSAPIISAVGPALTSLINMLTAAINKVNQFISALTGKSTWTKATTQVVNYAGGLNSAASGADKAAKAAKKLKGQLQSFNELNVINSNDSGSGSGGSGGSGGGGGVSDMFEEVPIDSGIKNLADEIRKAIETGDWEGLGETISSKITESVGKIDWDSAYDKAKNFGTNFASFLNGLFSNDKKGNNVFTATADIVAGALNTAIFASKGFTDKFNFKEFGHNLATGFNRFFRKFKWKQCAEAINGWVDGFWDFVVGFFNGLSFEDIFNGLKDFITNLDSKTIATFIGIAAIKKFGRNIATAIEENTVVKATLNKVGITIAGVTFAWAAGTEIGKLIDDWIADEIRKSGGDLELADLYENFHWTGEDGFFDQIFGNGESVTETIYDIGTALQMMYADIFDAQAQFWGLNISANDFLKTIRKLPKKVIGIGVKITTTAKELWSGFKKGWEKYKKDPLGFALSIISKAKDLWDGFKEKWGETRTANFLLKIASKISELWNDFKTSWGNSRIVKFLLKRSTTVKELWDSFSSGWGISRSVSFILKRSTTVKELWDKFKDGWGTKKYVQFLLKRSTTVKELWDNFKNSWGLSKKVQIGISFFKGALSNLWTSVKNAFSGKSVEIGTKAAAKADGGIYYGGMWHDIAHYALGTENAPTGQVFIAREAGPELVGTIGNHTSVLNNGQIVASVSDGVYRAVKSAMGSGKQNLNVTFKVEGDPNGIFRVTQKKANEYFRATGNPAFEF